MRASETSTRVPKVRRTRRFGAWARPSTSSSVPGAPGRKAQPMRYCIVDTFAGAGHLGNPAAVVSLRSFPGDDVMQDAAHRIGVPTTAFVVPVAAGEYRVRWFTPFAEVNLCGHATI